MDSQPAGMEPPDGTDGPTLGAICPKPANAPRPKPASGRKFAWAIRGNTAIRDNTVRSAR